MIPIQTDGVAKVSLNSKLPKIDHTKISVTEQAITIEFTDGIQNQYGIEGYLGITMRGENSEENSTHSVTIGGKKLSITHSKGGSKGVFAGKPETKVVLETNKDGQIRTSGFLPGTLLIREVSVPERVSFSPEKMTEITLKGKNQNEVHTIKNSIVKTNIKVRKNELENRKADYCSIDEREKGDIIYGSK